MSKQNGHNIKLKSPCVSPKLDETNSPTPHINSESPIIDLRPLPYDPALLCLNYLPFISVEEITNSKIDDSKRDSSSLSCAIDSDDKDSIIVLLNNKI